MVGRLPNWLGNTKNMDKINLKVFFSSLIAIFIITVFLHLGIKMPQALNSATLVSSQTDSFEQIRSKLAVEQTAFSIKKTTNLIPEALASSEYDEAVAYGVIDFETGEVLLEKNFMKRLPIASITKVMAAVVALDLANPQELFRVSQKASKMVPSKIMLQSGETFKLEDMLAAALIASANDSAEVIKEGVDKKYGTEVFIRAMNLKAQNLGMNDSKFTNAQGFDNPNHYSSIHDLAILSQYAMSEYPLIVEKVGEEFEDIDPTDKRLKLRNWNGLLGVYPGVTGVKIGSTGDAGKTTVVLAEREGKKLLAILLGAPGVLERDLWTAKLLDAGFEKSLGLAPINISEVQLKEKYLSWQR
jgi:D-alanyl-D-alanine carboxypeptidase